MRRTLNIAALFVASLGIWILVILAIVAFTGCGDASLDFKTGKDNKSVATTTTTTEKTVQKDFQGSVQYAFELTVNNEKFDDIESYYTAQVQSLPAKVTAAGYVADSVEFVGRLGFTDFVEDMEVYVASSAGTQGKGLVDSQGNFSVTVANPNEKSDVSFKVRATKRVQVLLMNGGVVSKKLCYNFTAVEKDVVENPISLSNFKTDYTLYDCEQESEGLVIPEQASVPVPVRILKLVGSEEVFTKAGSNEFFVGGRKYLLPLNPTSAAYALTAAVDGGTPEEGFTAFGQDHRVATSRALVEAVDLDMGAGEIVTLRGSVDWTEVDLVRNGTKVKSFLVSFGLSSVVLKADGRILAVGRLPKSNSWKVGELDLHTNRFIPRADAPSGLLISHWGVIGTDYCLQTIESELHCYAL
jgi:hypothetical protein